jgi:hypothetical protein
VQVNFYETLTAAISDISSNGFDSQARIERWMIAIRKAAQKELIPEKALDKQLQAAMKAIYQRLVVKGGIFKFNPGVERFTLDKVRPKLRAELDRRIMASASLIKLNRQRAIASTLQRFSGWATSIPIGGTAQAKGAAKADIKKSLPSLPFEDRRVLIDQGHKFTASLSNILATDGGAIAVVWNSHFRQPGYNFREEHKERHGNVYALKGNWAIRGGLMKAGSAGYYEDVTAFGEEIFCRCFGRYVYALRDLPKAMLTAKGQSELTRTKVA